MAERREAARPSAGGREAGGLYFDPQGADFGPWVREFKNEVYRNWIVPEPVVAGSAKGRVDFEFTVERNGSMSAVRMLKSCGADPLDEAAHQALTASRFAQLPHEYGPPRITMQVSFFYSEKP
jgi:TonB family protein